MAKVVIVVKGPGSGDACDRRITAVFGPVAPPSFGYLVTAPLLPGLITYGRTQSEAREMARDAIHCHLEGLQKERKQIPSERN